ncbi:MAG: DNA topoisomerase IV subunit A [Pseudomonadota bacterium]|nr:DNA topoisomerase IV subunit A [Pseudomonadota bacterium]MEC8461181.1 DNA topoisomerase IV subunit A [Pseudomonadota bacterium]
MAGPLNIVDFAEKAYLDYAMYVILDRALPCVQDGLKPVQRRIIYAMHLLKLSWQSKFKKSSRTVGDVIGKFHPHGDAACYEAMVLMAQWFCFRYPLVDGQGNWGAIDDPKSFAAMRYTEARLTRFAQAYLKDIDAGGVSWVSNFDGTLKEPSRLPAILPCLLLNGATGIAVGMVTNIPPHNACEIIDACVLLLENPEANDGALLDCVPAPDYPTGGVCITPLPQMRTIYQRGEGAIKLRARYTVQGCQIVVDELPFKVSPARVFEQVAGLMKEGILPEVVDLHDQSDHECPLKMVIQLKKEHQANDVVAVLFEKTDMEHEERFVFNAIDKDRGPRLFSLAGMIRAWVSFRLCNVSAQMRHRLNGIEHRVHVLDGLILVFAHIDEIILLIRNHESPAPVLQERFNLTEQQAEAILEIKLRALSRLKEVALRDERSLLKQEAESIAAKLNSPEALRQHLVEQLQECRLLYGDKRRTKVEEAVEPQKSLPSRACEPVTVLVSSQGWASAKKGHSELWNMTYKQGDQLLARSLGDCQSKILIATAQGVFFSLSPTLLLEAGPAGRPLNQFLQMKQALLVAAFFERSDAPFGLIVTTEGYGLRCVFSDCHARLKAGRQIIVLQAPDTNKMFPPIPLSPHEDQTFLGLFTEAGRLLVLRIKDVPFQKKGKGRRLVHLATTDRGGDAVVASVVLTDRQSLCVASGKRQFTLAPSTWSGFVSSKGKKGALLPRGFRRVDGVTVLD